MEYMNELEYITFYYDIKWLLFHNKSMFNVGSS